MLLWGGGRCCRTRLPQAHCCGCGAACLCFFLLCALQGVFGFCTDAPLVFQPLGGGLFGVQDTEVELDDVASARLPPVPLQPSLALHWLVVEGVQPCIPENSARARTWDLLKTSDGGGGGGGSAEGRKRLRDGSTPGVLVRDGSVQVSACVLKGQQNIRWRLGGRGGQGFSLTHTRFSNGGLWSLISFFGRITLRAAWVCSPLFRVLLSIIIS